MGGRLELNLAGVAHPPKLAQAVREIAGEIAAMYGG